VIGFAQIAGGMPSSVQAMTAHLMNATLVPEQARLAAYYGRGMVSDVEEIGLDPRRAFRNEMHVDAWLAGTEPPDLVRLAEYAMSPDAALTPMEIEERLVSDIERAVASVDGEGAQDAPLPPEARVLHGLPEPPPLPNDLQGLSVAALQDRQERLIDRWSAATAAADYQADIRASEPTLDLNAPLAIIRPDLHPSVALGLGIGPTRRPSTDEINALLAGRRADGEKVEGKHYAKARRLPVDPKTGEVRYSGPIGSYDFCPTPDKSVSIAWAFARPVEQAQIYNAHLEAAREALGYIARHVGQARLGDGGKDGAEPGHVGWLEFTHHTARRTMISVEGGEVKLTQDEGSPGDPDLHTHFLIPNAVFCDSGRVGSLDTAAIQGFIFEADAFYQARLAQNLRDAGFEVALDQKTGAARLPIIPDEIRTLFSKRTNIGELLARKMTADRGEEWDTLSQEQREARMKAATQSLDQKVKGGKDDIANMADWKRQARETCGWEPTTLQLYGPPVPPLEPEQRIRVAYDTALPFLAERLEQRSVVPHFDLRVAAARGLVVAGIGGLADIDAVTATMRSEGVQQYSDKTALVWGLEVGKRYTSVTTALHESDEQAFLRLARQAAEDRSAAIPARLLNAKVSESGLDFSGAHGVAQRSAIDRLGTGGRFAVAIGAAGAGKSAMLKPLVAAWREQGRDVHGASLAWRQADELTDAGIDRRNVKAFSVLIDSLRAGSLKLTGKSVVAVDEWGLLGTRQGLELLRLREEQGFQIVALGDDKQCASIEAGAIIDLSRRALGTEHVPQILTTVRQQTAREREIVLLFREGRAAEALNMKRADGTAEMALGGYDGVVARTATLYAERMAATGHAPALSAPTNADAHRISEVIRIERRRIGQLGPDMMTVRATDGERDYSLALAKGDHVRLFKSTGAKFGEGRGGSIGRNGSVLEVVDAGKKGLTLKAKSGKVGTVSWADLTNDAGRVRLAYGDAMTIHTAQGSTAKEHIFVLPSGSQAVNGLAGYTANTRHRDVAYLITNEQAERIEVRKRRPLNDTRDISVNDVWANVARSFSYQPEKDSAIALSERVSQLRRGSVKLFQTTLLPAGSADRVGRSSSRGAGMALSRKVDTELEKDGSRLRMAVQQTMVRMRRVYQEITHRVRQTVDREGPSQRPRGPSLRL
jgi:hypothetical protein